MVLLSKLCLVAAAIATVGLNSLNVEGNELVKPIGKSISHSSFEDNISEYEQRIRRLGGYNSYNNYNNAFLFSKFKKSGTTDSSSKKGKFFNKKDSSDGKGTLFGKKFDSSSSDGKDGLFGKKGGLFNKKDSSSSDNKGGLFGKKFGSSSSSDGKGKLFSKKDSSSSDNKGGLFGKKDSSSDGKFGLFGKKFVSSSDNKRSDSSDGKFGKGSRDSSSDSSDSSDSSNGKSGLFSKKKSWLFGKKYSSDSSSSSDNKGGLLSKVFRKKDSSSSSRSSSRSSSSSNRKGGLLSKKFGKKFDSSSSDRKGGLLGKIFGKKRSSSSSSRSKSKSSSSDDDDDNDRFALRINCGGLGTDDYCEDYRYFNVNGDLWKHDCKYQDNDNAQIFKVSDDIYDIDENGYKFLADDQEIYQSERFIRDDDLVYNFDVNNGKYFIKLYFAEMFFTTRHERIFDIEIEGKIVEYDLDIYSRVGHDTALVLQYNDIYVNDHVLTIKFLKNVQDPKVNGIEIFQVE